MLVAPVPWVTTPPDLIEQIVAVLLGNRNPEALRIRPSRGDGGLDVLVPAARPGYFDCYQVKRFATNLEDSQKRQIVESLRRARDTHNDPSNPFLIVTWLLTLPLDPTREQYQWLRDEAADANVPFDVEWRGLVFLEGLASDYPQVIDYYLRDGKDRLEGSIAALRDLAQLPASRSGTALEPADAVDRLRNLGEALNRDDPHYRYDFEVTANEPILLDRPFLVASVVDATVGSYVTFHVYARYRDAPEDRPIPVSFSIVRTNLSPEAAEAVEQMLQYGTPVSLPESAVTDVNIDIPGGLGMQGGGGSIWLGPAHAVDAEPSRAVWAILPPGSVDPEAQLTFVMEPATRGVSGGIRVHGVDTTGVVDGTIIVDPPAGDGIRQVRLSAAVIDPKGKPVGQVLPGLRFMRQFRGPGRLAFGAEYGPLAAASAFALSESSPTISDTALAYVEALEAISQRSGKLILLPELTEVPQDEYKEIIGIGRVLRGEQSPFTWAPIRARVLPARIGLHLDVARRYPMSQDVAVRLSGVEHALGKLYTYLLSARIEVDADAEPDKNGAVPATIVPGDNNQGVMTDRFLSPEEVEGLTA
jgi:hypothetical protein